MDDLLAVVETVQCGVIHGHQNVGNCRIVKLIGSLGQRKLPSCGSAKILKWQQHVRLFLKFKQACGVKRCTQGQSFRRSTYNNGLEEVTTNHHARHSRRRERRANALIRGHQSNKCRADPLDQAQIVTWEITIEELHWRSEWQYARLQEPLEGKRILLPK